MAPPLDLRRIHILGKGHPDKRAAMQIIVTRQRLLNRTIVPIARDISNEKGRVSSRGGAGRHSQHTRPLRLAILICVTADNSQISAVQHHASSRWRSSDHSPPDFLAEFPVLGLHYGKPVRIHPLVSLLLVLRFRSVPGSFRSADLAVRGPLRDHRLSAFPTFLLLCPNTASIFLPTDPSSSDPPR